MRTATPRARGCRALNAVHASAACGPHAGVIPDRCSQLTSSAPSSSDESGGARANAIPPGRTGLPTARWPAPTVRKSSPIRTRAGTETYSVGRHSGVGSPAAACPSALSADTHHQARGPHCAKATRTLASGPPNMSAKSPRGEVVPCCGAKNKARRSNTLQSRICLPACGCYFASSVLPAIVWC